MSIFNLPARTRFVKLFVVILFTGLLPMLASAQVDGDFRSLATGNWNVNTTWQRYNGTTSTWVAATAGQFPGATADVLIRNGHTVTLNAATSCKNLVVGEGLTGILTMPSTFTMSVSGTTVITAGGRINVTSTSGIKSFTGDFTNNGTWNYTGSAPITFLGNVTNNGTFTSGSGTYSFSGTGKTVTTTNSSALTITAISWLGTVTVSSNFAAGNPFTVTTATLSNSGSVMTNNGVMIIPTLAMSSGSSSVLNNGTITVNTAMSGSGTFTNNNGGVLNYGGSGAIAPTLAVSTNANTVNYTRAGTQTVKGTTYHHLTISGSNTKTLGAATTVNRDLIITGTATLADGAFAITGNALGTFQIGSGAGYTTTRTATNWFATNTPLANYTIDDNSTVTFGGATYLLLNNIPSAYGHLIFTSSGTKTLPASFPITVNGNLTLTTGTMADNGNTITVKGSIASTGTQSGAGKVLLSSGAAAHGMEGSGWNNVELNDAQGATLTAAFTIGTAGTFTLSNGVVGMGNFNFFIDNPTGGLAGSGFSATKMILQNGTGNFNHIIATSGLPVTYLYPIGENTGTTEYSPVSITVNANSSLTDLAFRVVDAQHPNDASATNYASRYWTVPNTSTTIADYTASFGYTAADIMGSETTFDVFTYNTSTLAWSYIPATAAANLVTYDGNNTDGITTTTAFTVKAPLSIPSVVTIDGVGGSAGVYANLTGTTGLFAALNQAVITGNITVNVTATPIAEPGTVALNQVNESGAGAGTYTITIQSNNSTQKVLEGNYAGVLASPGIFRLNGADRVTFNGGTGTDRRLLFRNTNTNIYAGVFQFLNDASENKINNCTVEGSITSTSLGLVHIGTSVAGGTGNDDIIITNNDIKQAGVNLPGIGISGDGFSATVENDGAEISNNNIYNIYRTSSTVAAIYINGFNTGWTISGNKIYQEAARSGSLTSSIYGIYFATTTSDGFSITDNIIGYANASGTGTTSFASTSTFRFSAISSNGTTSSVANTISNNIIDNISVTTTSGGSPTLPAFSGIMVNGGKALVDGNYIGSTSGVPSIVITGPTVTAANSPTGIGGNSTATSGVTFSNNHIGGMSYTLSSGNVAVNLTGIRVNVGNVTVTDNEIGNSTAASFLVTNTGTGSALCYGIWGGISSGYTLNITDNTIRNLATASTATTSQVAGINATSSGNYTIDGNTIHNLTSNSLSTSSTVPSVVGITATPGGSLSHSVSGNTIYALSNTNIVNSVVTGIYFTGNSTVSQINKNFIYNLRSGTGTASVINGIHIGASTAANVSNNRIRLGYDETGLPIINTSVITGILKDNTTAGNSVYYNSVYIGGTGVGVTASNTYAFRRLLAGSTDNFRNNIFVNARGNAAGGGKHYGLYLISTTNLTEDYNLIYAPGTGGVLASVNGTDQTTMTAWKAANSGLDVSSVSADPQFEDATAVTPNLKLKTNVATPAESGAIAISGLTDDFESTNIRTGYPLGLPQGGTAPDMGADEANLIPKDVLPPVITLTPVANISAACGTSQTVTVTATVTDPSGVATGSLAPTLWWRESTGTYAALLPASVSGTTYTYTLNITGVSAGQTYHYYIAAQDLASPANIGYSSGAPVHANVSATPSPINGSPSSFLVNSGTPLSGTVTVGSGGTYTTFANTGGLFEAINANGLSGDLIVLVTSNIADNNVHSLNNIAEYCGSGYTVYIRPQTATTKVVSVTAANGFGFGFIKLTGADRVIIDGSFNSGSNTAEGTGNYLTFQNNYSSTANVAGTIYMDGVCQNITIRNCNIEGRGHNLQGGNVIINTSGASSVAIDKCNIKGVTSSSVPNNLVYSAASGAGVFSITNCNLYDFSAFGGTSGTRATAILVSGTLSPSASWTISGNSIYNTTIDSQGPQTAINFAPGAASNNNVISGNYIGGSAPQCAALNGTVYGWITNYDDYFSGLNEMIGVSINAGTINVTNNTIQNLYNTNTDNSGLVLMEVTGSTQPTITGNLFGSTDFNKRAQCSGGAVSLGSYGGYVIGLYLTNSGATIVDDNDFYFLVSSGASAGGYSNPIYAAATGAMQITNNIIDGNQAAGINFYSCAIEVAPASSTGAITITGNQVTLPYINNSASGRTNMGIMATGTNLQGKISNNFVIQALNNSLDGVSEAIWLRGSGNWEVSNNSVTMNNALNGAPSRRVSFYGIEDNLNSSSVVKVYNNSVLIDGTIANTGTADNSSFAFFRYPNGNGTTVGSQIDVKNNIFVNNRTGGNANTKHYAIANFGTSNFATNWGTNASDYNLLVISPNASGGRAGAWGGSGYNQFANWQAGSSSDANSQFAFITTGTSSATEINISELFTNTATGDLHIKTTAPGAPYPYDFASNKGTSLAAVTVDYDNEPRTSTPDIGADEFLICTIPVVSANTPTNPTCTGNDGTIALSGLAANTGFAVTYNKNGSPVASANYTANGSGVLTITGLDGGTYNNIVVSLGAGCSSAAYPSSGNITLTNPVCGPNTWQGDVVATPTDWFNAGNWSANVVPNSCASDAVIPTNPSGGNFFPIINAAGAQVGNITVQAGATIGITSTRTLTVCGNWTGSTTATPSTVTGAGRVVFTGNAAQAVTGRTTFSTLQVAKNTGTTATIQAGSNIDVTTALELASGTLANSGNLTLKSTATEHAIFNDFGAPVGTYTGTYSGTIKEERYYRATSANSYNQHYMGSPVSNATLTQFGAGSTSGAVTPTADCSETQLDQTSVYGSVFSYNEADGAVCPMKSWNVKAGATAATPAQGFSVAKTGAGTLTITGTPNTAASYSVTGLANSNWTKGTLQHPSPTAFGSGWHLVSNPYNATLDLTSITPPAGFDNQIQVWDVIQGQYYTLTGTKLIAPFQAFFVHKNGTPGSTYTIDGNWRVVTAATFYALNAPEELTITATNTGNSLYDVTTVAFNTNATDQFDAQYDANKLTGSIGRHNLSTQNNGYELNTNTLTSIATTSTVNMTFEPGQTGSYTLTFGGLNSFDPTSYIMLEDKKLNTMYDVRNGDYSFTADATDDWNRFVLHFTPKAEITTVDQQCETQGAINIVQPGTANWNYTITDNNGTAISTGTLNSTSPISAAAATGTYTLTLTDANNYQVVKTVTVNGTTPVTAAFTPSVNNTTTNTNVAFNSSTQGAADYYWDFGDGTTATGQNVIHSYGDTGTYTVTLIVLGNSGCSNNTTQTITVTEIETGVNNLNQNKAITIWSNGNTVYVDFSRLTKTDATIEIYNVLGQQLVNERYKANSIYTTAIGNLEAAYVLVKVKQGDSITTKKVLIANTK